MRLKEALQPLFKKKPYAGLSITKIESIAGLGKGTLTKAFKVNSIRTGLIERLCAPTGQEMHLIFKKKKKLILNIYILFVMKWLKYPGSVSEEERTQNKNDAFKAACLFNDDIWSAHAASYASDAAGDIAAVNNISADICNYEKAQEWVDKYFRITGENKQDYFDHIKKGKS